MNRIYGMIEIINQSKSTSNGNRYEKIEVYHNPFRFNIFTQKKI